MEKIIWRIIPNLINYGEETSKIGYGTAPHNIPMQYPAPVNDFSLKINNFETCSRIVKRDKEDCVEKVLEKTRGLNVQLDVIKAISITSRYSVNRRISFSRIDVLERMTVSVSKLTSNEKAPTK